MTVKQKQWQLHYLGYYGGKKDGIWGKQSKAATVRFQKDHALDADGIFGALTVAKSIEIIRAIQKEITDGKMAIDGLAGQETKAVDLRIEGKSARQTLAWAQNQREVRYAYAIDTSFVHMDIE